MLLRFVLRVRRNADLWTRVGFGQDPCDAVEKLDKLLTGLGAEDRPFGQVDEFIPASNVECGTWTATDIVDKASRDASQVGVNRLCVCRRAFEIFDKVHAVVYPLLLHQRLASQPIQSFQILS
jgi:hypothetical protein